mmetsp:Transcript_14697/g.15880  ORF Transcript_14697/g.15880 Transcript_14697/m.15880 type:complete len:92 (+) Transcript_14697:2111-2386(+)
MSRCFHPLPHPCIRKNKKKTNGQLSIRHVPSCKTLSSLLICNVNGRTTHCLFVWFILFIHHQSSSVFFTTTKKAKKKESELKKEKEKKRQK